MKQVHVLNGTATFYGKCVPTFLLSINVHLFFLYIYICSLNRLITFPLIERVLGSLEHLYSVNKGTCISLTYNMPLWATQEVFLSVIY